MRDQKGSTTAAEAKADTVPDGMQFLGEIRIHTDEILIWTQPDGARCFGFMPAHN